MPSGEAPFGNPPELPDGETFGGGNFSGNGNTPPDNADNRQNAAASDASAIPAAAMQTIADSSTDAGASAAAAMTTAAEDATSKGIKCGGNLTMSGGSCTIDSTDHAVHCLLYTSIIFSQHISVLTCFPFHRIRRKNSGKTASRHCTKQTPQHTLLL